MMKKDEAEKWKERIEAGKKYRKLHGLESVWADLEARFYSCTKESGTGPNILFSKGDVIISALSTPQIRVMVEALNNESLEWSPIVEAFDNALMEALDVSSVIETALTYAYLWGVGFIKIGFDSEYGFDPQRAFMGATLTQFSKKGELIESGIAQPGFPWVKAVLPHDVVVPWGTRELRDAEWIAHRIVRRVEDVKADPKYSGVRDLKGSISLSDLMKAREQSTQEGGIKPQSDEDKEKDYVELWEIQDKRSRRVIVLVDGDDGPRIIRNVENALQLENQLPWVEISLNPRSRSLWTTPPAFFIWAHQRELDDIHDQAKKQRRASVMALAVRGDAFDESTLQQLRDGKPGAILLAKSSVDSMDDIVKVIGQNINVNTLLHMEEGVIHQNAREALGISRNLAGEYSGRSRVTARETFMVSQGAELRLGLKQMRLRRALLDMVRKLNAIVGAYMELPFAVRILGTDRAPQWKELRREMLLQGRYGFRIAFSTEYYETPESRLQKVIGLYQVLMNDPRVDQEAALDLLLHVIGETGIRRIQRAPLRVPMQEVPGEGGAPEEGGGATPPSEV